MADAGPNPYKVIDGVLTNTDTGEVAETLETRDPARQILLRLHKARRQEATWKQTAGWLNELLCSMIPDDPEGRSRPVHAEDIVGSKVSRTERTLNGGELFEELLESLPSIARLNDKDIKALEELFKATSRITLKGLPKNLRDIVESHRHEQGTTHYVRIRTIPEELL